MMETNQEFFYTADGNLRKPLRTMSIVGNIFMRETRSSAQMNILMVLFTSTTRLAMTIMDIKDIKEIKEIREIRGIRGIGVSANFSVCPGGGSSLSASGTFY